MSLKVTGGIYKGRKIACPKNIARPTQSIMRQSLFNSIQTSILDAFFLDLFSGSGIMGIEAISRGAKYVTFVDKSPLAVKVIKSNLSSLQIQIDHQVISNDAIAVISQLDTPYDFIYLDPPYKIAVEIAPKVLYQLQKRNILKDDGSIFLEMSSNDYREFEIENLKLVKHKKFGSSVLQQYKHSF
ncbi:MAG: 16S rRNA (guanine(966)-N(2))-methyltransferase RsmD [Chlamydiae bacterium CG10_big_fil_rev_8_21_14_0_10_35_9]|nr:MAG: 16S rRNA (guanine(966)-N(2))-methyltransferase RsmD [Chlamydiae bacterium CG10_big_fil_rev_8_21_14_0_10_35_9]